MNRSEELFEKISKSNIDALFVTGIPNIRYITNFSGEEGFLLVTQNELLLIVDSRFTEQAKGEIFDGVNVIEYKDKIGDFVEDLLKERKIHWLGVEKERINLDMFSTISNIPTVKPVPLSNFVESIRMVKDESELANITSACEISIRSFNETLPLIKEGVTERRIAAELEFRFRKNGSEKPAFVTILASGERGALPHGIATNKKIKAHEPIVIDFGASYNGYDSDITRIVSIGEPSEEFKNYYKSLQEAQQIGREFVKAGLKVSDLDKKVRDYLSEKGLGFGHSLGHGVGLEIHELPYINATSTFTLEENMVITIEPGLYFPGKFGMRIEDTVIVKKDGIVQLNSLPHNIIIL